MTIIKHDICIITATGLEWGHNSTETCESQHELNRDRNDDNRSRSQVSSWILLQYRRARTIHLCFVQCSVTVINQACCYYRTVYTLWRVYLVSDGTYISARFILVFVSLRGYTLYLLNNITQSLIVMKFVAIHVDIYLIKMRKPTKTTFRLYVNFIRVKNK